MQESKGKLTFYNTWAVLYCDEGLRSFYSHLLLKEKCIKVMKPRWGSHISVIRGESIEFQYQKKWAKNNNKIVKFEYSVEIEDGIGGNGLHYFWLPIRCNYLLDIREELGLQREPMTSNGLHLTLGQIPEYKPTFNPNQIFL